MAFFGRLGGESFDIDEEIAAAYFVELETLSHSDEDTNYSCLLKKARQLYGHAKSLQSGDPCIEDIISMANSCTRSFVLLQSRPFQAEQACALSKFLSISDSNCNRVSYWNRLWKDIDDEQVIREALSDSGRFDDWLAGEPESAVAENCWLSLFCGSLAVTSLVLLLAFASDIPEKFSVARVTFTSTATIIFSSLAIFACAGCAFNLGRTSQDIDSQFTLRRQMTHSLQSKITAARQLFQLRNREGMRVIPVNEEKTCNLPDRRSYAARL